MLESAPSQDRRNEKSSVSCQGEFLPSHAPMEEGREDSCPSSPSIDLPDDESTEVPTITG